MPPPGIVHDVQQQQERKNEQQRRRLQSSRRCVCASACVYVCTEEVEKCVCACRGWRVGVLRSAHYVAKTKTKKTVQENRKVDAQFVLGAPMTRCACGCMCWMGESQAHALYGRACDVSGQRENKRGVGKGRGWVVRTRKHASFSPVSHAPVRFSFSIFLIGGRLGDWLTERSHFGSMVAPDADFVLFFSVKRCRVGPF